MNRRQFLRYCLGTAPFCGVVGTWPFSLWPEQGYLQECRNGLPTSITRSPWFSVVWEGIDSTQVWDCHVHLVGSGDSGSGAWFNPKMDSWWHPGLRLQKRFYLNAGCIAHGQMDTSYVARLQQLLAGMAPGCKVMLLAFDWRYDDQGRLDQGGSLFYIPNHYAAMVARQHPSHFEWVASIHPYRLDCVEVLQQATAAGARAIKWLPSAMGIDPASARCDRFYRALAQSGLPLISHGGRELAVPGGDQDQGNPLRLRRAMDHGVKVVVAHCASDGDDVDLDRGQHGSRVSSFDLFARLMAEPRYEHLLSGDISVLTQRNRVWALKKVLQRSEWHARLLHGSDYPLPGIMPLFSVNELADEGLLDAAALPFLKEIRLYNALLFDFALKRLLRSGGRRFPVSVFQTRGFFTRRI